MALGEDELIPITAEPHVMQARGAARRMAAGMGFDERGIGEIETTVSELATNLLSHRTVNGAITLKPLMRETGAGMEILASDQGPGIADLEKALRGGESSAGTLGIGLSGARRLMDEFVISSIPGRGTLVTARKWLPGAASYFMNCSVISRPKAGEEVSGDAWYVKRFPDGVFLAVIDALGHGPKANEAAQKTLEVVSGMHAEPLERIVAVCDEGLRNTRGSAMAICRADFTRQRLEHLSIGNVETRVYGSPSPVHPICFNGTLGMIMESHRVMEYPFARNAIIVMFSDGISGRFDLTSGDLLKSPQQLATSIFEGFAKGTDDATILVGR